MAVCRRHNGRLVVSHIPAGMDAAPDSRRLPTCCSVRITMPLLRRGRATRCRNVSTSRGDQRSPRQTLASSTAIGWIGLHPRVVTPSNHATTMKVRVGFPTRSDSQQWCRRQRRFAHGYCHLRHHRSGRHRPFLRAVHFRVPVGDSYFYRAHVTAPVAAPDSRVFSIGSFAWLPPAIHLQSLPAD
jgi:hypothetical protein